MQRERELLVIEWEDIRTQGSWHKEEDIKLHSPCNCITVGWRVSSSKKGCVSLASSRCFITETTIDCSDVTTIPRRNIIKMRKLE